jgi:hypothetical protein
MRGDVFPVLWNVCNMHCALHACPCVTDEGFRGLLTLIVQDKTGFSILNIHYIYRHVTSLTCEANTWMGA